MCRLPSVLLPVLPAVPFHPALHFSPVAAAVVFRNMTPGVRARLSCFAQSQRSCLCPDPEQKPVPGQRVSIPDATARAKARLQTAVAVGAFTARRRSCRALRAAGRSLRARTAGVWYVPPGAAAGASVSARRRVFSHSVPLMLARLKCTPQAAALPARPTVPVSPVCDGEYSQRHQLPTASGLLCHATQQRPGRDSEAYRGIRVTPSIHTGELK